MQARYDSRWGPNGNIGSAKKEHSGRILRWCQKDLLLEWMWHERDRIVKCDSKAFDVCLERD